MTTSAVASGRRTIDLEDCTPVRPKCGHTADGLIDKDDEELPGTETKSQTRRTHVFNEP